MSSFGSGRLCILTPVCGCVCTHPACLFGSGDYLSWLVCGCACTPPTPLLDRGDYLFWCRCVGVLALLPLIFWSGGLFILGVVILCPLGKFHILELLWCILTCFALFLAVSVSFPMLCMSVCVLNPSARFTQPFGLSGCHLAPLLGEFCISGSFRCLLTASDMFAVVIVSCAMLCVSVHTLDASTWLLQPSGMSGVHFTGPLGESGSFLRFCGVLMLSPVCGCASAPPVCLPCLNTGVWVQSCIFIYMLTIYFYSNSNQVVW